MLRILLIGKTGQVGHYLLRSLARVGHVIAPDRNGLDLSRSASITGAIRATRPDVIVNAAGLTLVDQVEREPDAAMQVNGVAPGIMAEEARRCGALLVHYSTTFVFDGAGRKPSLEDDASNPVNAYGRSKLAAEGAISAVGGDYLILRAGWTYSQRRSNFPLALLKLAREKKSLSIVDDQMGAPTSARAYADTTAQLLKKPDRARAHSGVYHLSSSGQTTRYEWAKKIIELAQEHEQGDSLWAALHPIPSTDYPHVAPRPLYTVVDNSKIRAVFGIQMGAWEDQLKAFVREWAQQESALLS